MTITAGTASDWAANQVQYQQENENKRQIRKS